VRGAARGLIVAAALLLVGAFATACAAAEKMPPFHRAIRDLDGGQFLEDEPIWICDDVAPPGPVRKSLPDHVYRLIGVEDSGRRIRREAGRPDGVRWLEPQEQARAGELISTFALPVRPELHVLAGADSRAGGLRAGRYEIRRADVDTARVIARFRVIAPRGSELAVRAAVARASRLWESGGTTRQAEAAKLFEAILARYPRTSYRTAIYAGLFWDLGRSATIKDPGTWLSEVFAHFHNSCFGVWALDEYMDWAPPDRSGPLLRKLVGLYPDTRLSRAAARYL
jgi:hypothetical protein